MHKISSNEIPTKFPSLVPFIRINVIDRRKEKSPFQQWAEVCWSVWFSLGFFGTDFWCAINHKCNSPVERDREIHQAMQVFRNRPFNDVADPILLCVDFTDINKRNAIYSTLHLFAIVSRNVINYVECVMYEKLIQFTCPFVGMSTTRKLNIALVFTTEICNLLSDVLGITGISSRVAHTRKSKIKLQRNIALTTCSAITANYVE